MTECVHHEGYCRPMMEPSRPFTLQQGDIETEIWTSSDKRRRGVRFFLMLTPGRPQVDTKNEIIDRGGVKYECVYWEETKS